MSYWDLQGLYMDQRKHYALLGNIQTHTSLIVKEAILLMQIVLESVPETNQY